MVSVQDVVRESILRREIRRMVRTYDCERTFTMRKLIDLLEWKLAVPGGALAPYMLAIHKIVVECLF